MRGHCTLYAVNVYRSEMYGRYAICKVIPLFVIRFVKSHFLQQRKRIYLGFFGMRSTLRLEYDVRRNGVLRPL